MISSAEAERLTNIAADWLNTETLEDRANAAATLLRDIIDTPETPAWIVMRLQPVQWLIIDRLLRPQPPREC